jgi:hypothetical protein
MLKKYVSKFTIDILPSVLATIIGAYIVNHYIVAKPAGAPAAAVSTADPVKADPKASQPVAAVPEAGVKAKGISEKAILEKTASEKPTLVDKPADTASLPAEPRRHQPAPREKPAAKAVQTPAALLQAPAPDAAAVAPTAVEAALAPEEKRDANELARAAIERLRNSNEAPRGQETARSPEAPGVDLSHVGAVTPVQPLPSPIMISTPRSEPSDSATGSLPTKPPYGSVQVDDPQRPTPPADIPSVSVDLRAEATLPPPRQHRSVAEDVLSAAKSVFHAVLPR